MSPLIISIFRHLGRPLNLLKKAIYMIRDQLFLAIFILSGFNCYCQSFPTGTIVDTVKCIGNEDQSYALYLPEAYGNTTDLPIMFLLDPGARGSFPLKNFKYAAEKYGYIIACSNNSRNGPIEYVLESARSMIDDALTRFTVDKARIYSGGFSGGARSAITLSVLYKEFVGVVGCGAGMDPGTPFHQPTKNSDFDYVSIVGNQDMNFLELHKLKTHLTSMGINNRLLKFDGTHEWPDSLQIIEAFSWLQVFGMNRNLIKKDEGQVDELFQQFNLQVEQLIQEEQLIDAVDLIDQIEKSFDSQPQIHMLISKKEEILSSKQYKKEVKSVQKVFSVEEELIGRYQLELLKLRSTRLQPQYPNDTTTKQKSWWLNQIDIMKSNSKSKKPLYSAMYSRISNLLFGMMAETTVNLERENDIELAIETNDILIHSSPEPVWPLINMARLYAKKGDYQLSLSFLEKANEIGIPVDMDLNKIEEFELLKETEEFQKIAN